MSLLTDNMFHICGKSKSSPSVFLTCLVCGMSTTIHRSITPRLYNYNSWQT